MMPKRLLALNVVMAAVAAVAVMYIVQQAMAPMPMPGTGRARAAVAATTAAAPADTPRLSTGAYGVVTARNLFSPTRSEAPITTGMAANTPPLVKPNLFGVVLREGAPIAYLEDPATKRVAGYRVGDSIVGGTIKTISADGVTITRPDGAVDVRLRDPSRPRPAPVAQAPPTAGQPGAPPVAGSTLPGVIPPAATAPPQVAQPPLAPGQPPPGFVPGRRPLPPNLLRRMPQPPPSDAPQQ